MGAQPHLSHLFHRDSDPGFINRRVQVGLTTKTSRRSRRPNEIEDRFVTVQGVPRPVGTHQVKHAMLNQVPFGSAGRIMRDCDNQAGLVSQTLQAHFPQAPSIAVGPTAIGLDQQVGFAWIKHTAHFQPPRPDGGYRKLGGIVRRAHHDETLVMTDVIDAIGNGFALGQVQKVVHIHLAPLLPPFRPGLLKVANQLTLFGIDTDGRPTAAQISLSPAPKVAKLLVPLRRLLPGHSFVIDPQRIISQLQQATNRRQTDRIRCRQGLLDFAQRLVGPLQARNRVASRFFGQQGFQRDQQSRRFFSVRGRPPPLARIRSLKSLSVSSPWPRVIVVRLKPVTWARRVTPP